MTDPDRLLEDDSAPPELQELLRRAPRSRGLDPAARERGRRRVALLAAPAALLAGVALSGKAIALSAAAGAVAGATAVGAILFVVPAIEQPTTVAPSVLLSAPTPAPLRAPNAPRAHVSSSPSLPAPVAEEAASPERREPALARVPPPATSTRGTSSLAEESQLLELARGALQAEPARALELSTAHERRFLKPRLAAERQLIRIEALYRLDRHAEARRLAEQWLAQGTDNLYRERVQRLLEKID